MSQQERSIKKQLGEYLEEQRKLHLEILSASNDAKLAAAEAKSAASTISKSSEDISRWTLSIQKRVEKLEHWRTALATGGFLLSYVLWDKAKKVLGLS